MANLTLSREEISSASLKAKAKLSYLVCKRLIDISLTVFLLTTLLPLMLFLAALIKFSSNGPVIFKSMRIGKNGKVFFCYKFRTMHRNADQKFDQILQDKKIKKEWVRFHKIKNDPRVFAFGKILRKYSLDELPQLFNVLKGDISLVGPRPIAIEEKELANKILKEQVYDFFSVKPGITGIWQTSGRSLISFEERLKIDLSYIEKRSIMLDILLLMRTIPVVIFSKGAY